MIRSCNDNTDLRFQIQKDFKRFWVGFTAANNGYNVNVVVPLQCNGTFENRKFYFINAIYLVFKSNFIQTPPNSKTLTQFNSIDD